MSAAKPVRVLAIAGSDSSGGAGIQADIKTIQALGGYAMTAITAITAQNTLGVDLIETCTPDMVRAQIRAVLEDIGVDAVKIGMLGDTFIVAAVADALADVNVPIILDPVMIASSGARLLDDDALSVLRTRLMPMARLFTPNIPEAETLSGLAINTVSDQRCAANRLVTMGPQAVLLKGGHGDSDTLTDVLVWEKGEALLESKRIATRNTHGTGCTLASAIAVFLAQDLSPTDAVRMARRYVRGAIKTAPGFGKGHGPLNHEWMNNGDMT